MRKGDQRPGSGRVWTSLAILLALLSSSCASGRLKEFSLVPEGGAVAATARLASGLEAKARYLDQEAMAQYVKGKGLGDLAYQLRSLKILAFTLSMTNGGTADVMVDPRGTRLFHGTKELLPPLESASLYMELPTDANRQQILRDLQILLFEGITEIEPGGSVERMVLFMRPETFGREGLLMLQGIYVNGVPAEMSLVFQARPLE